MSYISKSVRFHAEGSSTGGCDSRRLCSGRRHLQDIALRRRFQVSGKDGSAFGEAAEFLKQLEGI